MSREYTIGEVAELLQVSRDTLRFYEKKKLVSPKKGENGYRYYSEEDIRMLLDLVFLRRLQYSIQDIREICQNGSIRYMRDFLDLRIEEEERLIHNHQKMLRQLIYSRYIREKVMHFLHQYTVCPIPKTYIFSEMLPDYDSVRDEWFQASTKGLGLENCFLHEWFTVQEDGSWKHQCCLVLEEYAVQTLKMEDLAKTAPSFAFDRCVRYIYASEHVSPQRENIEAMIRWAGEQGIELTGEIHAQYLWNHYQEGKLKTSYVELYMPVKKASETSDAGVPQGEIETGVPRGEIEADVLQGEFGAGVSWGEFGAGVPWDEF